MIEIPDFDRKYLTELYNDAALKKKNAVYREINADECEISYMRSIRRDEHALECGLSGVYKRMTYKMKEQPKLRKKPKNYFVFYRQNGKLLQMEHYTDGKRYFDFWQMFYEGDKRYCIPFARWDDDQEVKEAYGERAYVARFDGDFVTEEYSLDCGSIYYEKYTPTDDANKIGYYFIHYHPNNEDSETTGLLGIYEGYVTTDCERPEFHRTGGWSWYDDWFKLKYEK